MLKVVIADDDARMRSQIRMSIDWAAIGLEFIGAASNGLDALEMIERLHPDILITDVHMPGCSGLDLIQRAKAILPQLEAVIISEHAQFEYVQRAIRFDVCDYLLKPIRSQQIMQTLQRLAVRCKNKKQISSEIENLRKSSREDALLLQDRMMRDLLSDSIKSTDAQSIWQNYRFQFDAECLQLVLLQIDYDDARISPTQLHILENKTSQAFSQALNDSCRTMMIHISEGFGGMLIGFDEAKKESIHEEMRKCLNQLSSQSDLFGDAELTLAAAPIITDPQQLVEANKCAQQLLKERIAHGGGRILQNPPQRWDWNVQEMLKPVRQAIAELAESGSFQALEAALDRLEKDAICRNANGAEIYETIRSAAHVFLIQMQAADGKQKFEAFIAKMAHTGRAEKLFDLLRWMILDELDAFNKRKRSDWSRPIRLATEYVQKHYQEPITLEKICAEVGFSVSYFSSMFKRETGENFVRFLTRTRMERAKELLVQTNMPVSEICAQVGYSDLKYFTQTFRRETELSPGQYRKLYG